MLPPYFENLGKRLIKAPKLYFLDTGLATYLAGLHTPEAALQGPMGCTASMPSTRIVLLPSPAAHRNHPVDTIGHTPTTSCSVSRETGSRSSSMRWI